MRTYMNAHPDGLRGRANFRMANAKALFCQQLLLMKDLQLTQL
jgi:hypothetical protein